ncbi:MAG: hypothetical protein AAB602_00050 [Patescibacteria group bacterium]
MEKIAKLLGVEVDVLKRLNKAMISRVGRKGVLDRINEQNSAHIRETFHRLDIPPGATVDVVHVALLNAIQSSERELLAYLETVSGNTRFEKVAHLEKRIANVGKGFFLKKEFGVEILKKNRPTNLLRFLKLRTINQLLKKYDVAEIFSALRFIESNRWMHETFEKAYGGFMATDFEEREIDVKVLGPEWKNVAERFVAKKHHNVSHLKEFGVIFINPITEDIPGKFLRDFALLLHYFHEIEFYSKLFRRYSSGPDFTVRLKALLRGDVKNVMTVREGEWLIVQRYLFKENLNDPRLFLPRVNPESLHWLRGERDIARLGEREKNLGLEMWWNLDWVALYDDAAGRIASFDLEDNAMSAVSAAEGKKEIFGYHQREALWTKIFSEYVGGEDAMERLLVENFDEGSILFKLNGKI